MDSRWTKHIRDAGGQSEFLGKIRASTTIRDRLETLLKEELETLTTKSSQEKDFENPSWAYLQAFRNGKISTLRSILDLLDFKDN
jgi:hypothetical protein